MPLAQVVRRPFGSRCSKDLLERVMARSAGQRLQVEIVLLGGGEPVVQIRAMRRSDHAPLGNVPARDRMVAPMSCERPRFTRTAGSSGHIGPGTNRVPRQMVTFCTTRRPHALLSAIVNGFFGNGAGLARWPSHHVQISPTIVIVFWLMPVSLFLRNPVSWALIAPSRSRTSSKLRLVWLQNAAVAFLVRRSGVFGSFEALGGVLGGSSSRLFLACTMSSRPSFQSRRRDDHVQKNLSTRPKAIKDLRPGSFRLSN